jgi:CTP synthase
LGLGEHNAIVIHLTLVPYSGSRRVENKTYTAFSKTLMESGIKADILVCRTEHEISDEIRNN